MAPTKPCPICKEATSTDTQEHSFQCTVLRKNINMEGSYEDIFFAKVDKKLARTVEKIAKFREEFLGKD